MQLDLDTVRFIYRNAAAVSSRLHPFSSMHHTLRIPEEILLLLCILALSLLGGFLFWVVRLSRTLERKDETLRNELFAKDRQIQALRHRLHSIEETRTGYVNLITNMSFVMKNLSFGQRLEDLASTVFSLASNIIHTRVVEFYVYDHEEEVLKKILPHGRASDQDLVHTATNDLIATVARDRIILTKEIFNRRHLDQRNVPRTDGRLWMAAPIIFEKNLLGVIGIGRPETPNGTEKDLLSIIAQITGVVLYNQSFLIQAKRNADTDVLTGLHNRRYFYRMSRKVVEEAIREGKSISIFIFDIDHFKHYNDTNGHTEGDNLLRELGSMLRKSAPAGAIIARYGGEEFIVMLPSMPTEEAYAYAENLRAQIARHPFPHGEKQPGGRLSISGGVASFPYHGRSIQEVIRLADAALYAAKESGRNRIVIHQADLSMAGADPGPVFLGEKEETAEEASIPPARRALCAN